MGYSKEYRAKVEELMSAVLPITTRPMFGGVGITTEGIFFGLIAEDKLYFKVSELNRGDFEEAGMDPFYPFSSAKPMSYWELPAGVLEEPSELKLWIDKAVAVAEAAKKPGSRKS